MYIKMIFFERHAFLRLICFLGLFPVFLVAKSQYAPAAGQPGSTAIHKDSHVFIDWAKGCSVVRGPMDISRPELGLASAGTCDDALGKSGVNGTLSLGDGGHAKMFFDPPITNGTGWDFAVFENGFDDSFLELAFVEVSSDGQHFVRFPSASLTPTAEQTGPWGTLDPEKIHNLAGKYRLFYGTPFDLEQLKDSTGVDVQSITHVRVVDVVGCIDPAFATYDSHGNIINDPWPTPFPVSGFDLDAIGVINALLPQTSDIEIKVLPNPANPNGHIRIFFPGAQDYKIRITDIRGRDMFTHQLTTTSAGFQSFPLWEINLNNGMFIIHVISPQETKAEKFIYRKSLILH